MKPGKNSTEFYLVVGFAIFIGLFILLGYSNGDVAWGEALEALKLEGGAIMAYVISRSGVKAVSDISSSIKDKPVASQDMVEGMIIKAIDKMKNGGAK